MSQLADFKYVVKNTPLSKQEQAKLFLAILQVLGCELDDVKTVEDAIVYLWLK